MTETKSMDNDTYLVIRPVEYAFVYLDTRLNAIVVTQYERDLEKETHLKQIL